MPITPRPKQTFNKEKPLDVHLDVLLKCLWAFEHTVLPIDHSKVTFLKVSSIALFTPCSLHSLQLPCLAHSRYSMSGIQSPPPRPPFAMTSFKTRIQFQTPRDPNPLIRISGNQTDFGGVGRVIPAAAVTRARK